MNTAKAKLIYMGLTCLFVSCAAYFIYFLHNETLLPPDRVQKISSGSFSVDGSNSFSATQLPHEWLRLNLPLRAAWYKLEFQLDEIPSELYAIYFSTVSQNVVVYLNDVEVGSGGSMDEPISRNWPRPLLLPIAPENYKQGKNEVLIYLVSSPNGRGLLPITLVGPWEALLGTTKVDTC